MVEKDALMDAHRFDQLTKTFVRAGSRRSVIGGLLGGVIALSRSRAAGATHKTGHHCTPSDNHPCGTCLGLRAVCPTSGECCQDDLEPTSCEVVEDVGTGKVCGGSAEPRCCLSAGGSCADNCECCGARFCCDNQCRDDNCDDLD
jgi:hypothetical protein